MNWQFWRQANRQQLWVHVQAMWLLVRNPQAPLAPKIVAALVVAYALSPVDLIPDFIPVLGMLDDIILLPLGIALAIRLTPAPLWREMVAQAQAHPLRLAKTLWGLLLVVVLWAVVLGLAIWWLV